jgi:anaerobic ribonucleoside-triphosphate reductase activating protein
MEDSALYVNSISYPVTNLGPGKRIVLWVQGCSLNCQGCMAVSMLKRREENRRSVIELSLVIKEASQGLDGITISGGEPFEQAESLYELLTLVKCETHLDIMVYSGYTMEKLIGLGPAARRLLSVIDILIDGRFEQGNTNRKLWRGSDNQKLHVLSERAERYAQYAEEEYQRERELHVEIGDNFFKIIGIPKREFFKDFYRKCREVGFTFGRG